MIDYITVLQSDLDAAVPRLRQVTDAASATPRAPGKWSPREILGHLIDSASVNHERFLRAVSTEDLVFPGYDQDAWVSLEQYAATSWQDLIDLWAGFNRHVARVMSSIPTEARMRLRERHNLEDIAFRAVPATQPATLDHLMSDYVVHLEHHLTQILGEGWPFDPRSGSAEGRHVLDSDRLTLRELTPDDLPFVAEMLGDAETMRFYPKIHTPLEARLWLERQLVRYARDGHGLWLVVDRASGQKAGQVGLAIQEVDGGREPEIGWLIRRRFWRRGFATEAAAAVRDLAFDRLGLDRVISLIRPENVPSQGVARKIGMAVERQTLFHGYPHLVFAVRRGPASR